GVEEINLAQRVDYLEDHPFKPIKGYTRFFLIVDDNKAEYKESLTPDELMDSDLFRYQMRNWRVRDPYLAASGEIEGDLLKMNDDFGNCLMQAFHDNVLTAKELTYPEKVREVVPEHLRDETLIAQRNAGQPITAAQQMSRDFVLNWGKKQIKSNRARFDE